MFKRLGDSIVSVMDAIAIEARGLQRPRRHRTTLHSTNGKREVARRLRQIAEGQLSPVVCCGKREPYTLGDCPNCPAYRSRN